MPFVSAAANGTVVASTDVFVCQFGWLAALLLASGTLFGPGVYATLALAAAGGATLAPDMLRCVASITYANAYFSTAPGATALDAVQRARLLRCVTMRNGDVRLNGVVGEVAFVAVDEHRLQSLDNERLCR
jgi:hypothetical protein